MKLWKIAIILLGLIIVCIFCHSLDRRLGGRPGVFITIQPVSSGIVLFELHNRTEEKIVLDQQQLNPAVMVEMLDGNGRMVGTGPPSTPKEFSPDQLIDLLPDETISFEVNIERLIEDFNRVAWVRFAYSPFYDYHYPPDLEIWRDIVYSDWHRVR